MSSPYLQFYSHVQFRRSALFRQSCIFLVVTGVHYCLVLEIEIWDERMLIQSCALASLMVIRMRSTKELARDARFWFMIICMPLEGTAAQMLDTVMASISMFPCTWNNISLTRPFLASASLSMSPGNYSVIIFLEGRTVEEGTLDSGTKNFLRKGAVAGKSVVGTMVMDPKGPFDLESGRELSCLLGSRYFL
jgi:hypothetical protein